MAFKDYLDDKDMVIIAAFLIAVAAMFLLNNPHDIVIASLSGLFGIAVGRKIAGGTEQ